MADDSTTTTSVAVYEQVIGHKTQLAVSARELHEKLGVKKPFANWFAQYTKRGDWRKDNDFSVYDLEVKNPQGGRPSFDAALSIQMAEHIAMMTRTIQGRKVREDFRQARDQRDALLHDDPVERYPQLRAIRDLITATAEAQLAAERAEAQAQAAQLQAARAEAKAETAEQIAQEAVSATGRLTIEEFVIGNGLLRQFPGKLDAQGRRTWPVEVERLKGYCQSHGFAIVKVPVEDKPWPMENGYPVQALAWLSRHPTVKEQLPLRVVPSNDA